MSLSGREVGGRRTSSADTNERTATDLAQLRAFVGAFPKDRQRFVIHGASWTIGDKTWSFWQALCLQREPLFGGEQHIGRIERADGTFDPTAYRVGFGPEAIGRIERLPQEAQRLALLHGDDLLVVLPVDRLKELKSPAVTLVQLSP